MLKSKSVKVSACNIGMSVSKILQEEYDSITYWTKPWLHLAMLVLSFEMAKNLFIFEALIHISKENFENVEQYWYNIAKARVYVI